MLLKVFITTKINQDKKDIENSKTLILYKIFKKQKEKNPQHFFDEKKLNKMKLLAITISALY